MDTVFLFFFLHYLSMVTKYVLKTRSAHSKRPGVLDPKPAKMVAGVSRQHMQCRIITENSG